MKTTILTLTLSALCAFADNAPQKVSSMLDTLLEATESNNIEKFESVCDTAMKKAMDENKLKAVSSQVSGLMKNGYEKTFLGELDKITYKTYLWKIDFTTEGIPDLIAELSVSDDKASGFYLK